MGRQTGRQAARKDNCLWLDWPPVVANYTHTCYLTCCHCRCCCCCGSGLSWIHSKREIERHLPSFIRRPKTKHMASISWPLIRAEQSEQWRSLAPTCCCCCCESRPTAESAIAATLQSAPLSSSGPPETWPCWWHFSHLIACRSQAGLPGDSIDRTVGVRGRVVVVVVVMVSIGR